MTLLQLPALQPRWQSSLMVAASLCISRYPLARATARFVWLYRRSRRSHVGSSRRCSRLGGGTLLVRPDLLRSGVQWICLRRARQDARLVRARIRRPRAHPSWLRTWAGTSRQCCLRCLCQPCAYLQEILRLVDSIACRHDAEGNFAACQQVYQHWKSSNQIVPRIRFASVL